MTLEEEVKLERPMSEGDQIKLAIRTLFVNSRVGTIYTEEAPLRQKLHGVNGVADKELCLVKHPIKHGAVILWYE